MHRSAERKRKLRGKGEERRRRGENAVRGKSEE